MKSMAWRHGIGHALMRHMIDASEAAGIWTLQAGIFPENRASIRLHEKVGFRVVGRREKIGKMDGVWRDVILMERRSRQDQTRPRFYGGISDRSGLALR